MMELIVEFLGALLGSLTELNGGLANAVLVGLSVFIVVALYTIRDLSKILKTLHTDMEELSGKIEKLGNQQEKDRSSSARAMKALTEHINKKAVERAEELGTMKADIARIEGAMGQGK